MKRVQFSGPALQEGAAALIQAFPMLQKDMPKAIQIAEKVASAMVLEDAGRKIIQKTKD